MAPTTNATTPSSFTRPPYTTATARTASLGSSSGTGVQRAAFRRHRHYRFRFRLCTAAALGLVLLGHPGSHCYNGQSSSYYCNGVYALPVKGGSPIVVIAAPVDTLPPGLQPHTQQTQPHQQQQVLALHTSNSATFSGVSEVISGFFGYIRPTLSKYTSFATDDADTAPSMTVENSNNHNHFTLATANVPGMSSDMGRVLASELISEPETLALQDIAASITTSGQKQDEQYLAFLDLVTRVTGKSRDQAEKEIWEEWKITEAAVRKDLKMHLELHRKQDRVVTIEEGDSSIESKQVSNARARSAFEVKSKPKSEAGEKDHHHKGKEARVKGKERHGLKGTLEKNKGSVRASSTGGKGGDLKTTPSIFYVPHQDDDALAMSLGRNTSAGS